MTSSQGLRLGALGLLAAAAAAFSILALIALNSGGEVRIGAHPLLRIAAGYDRRVEAAFADTATPPPRDARRRAARLSQRSLAEFPYDTNAWLRLAYVDYLDHGSLSPQGVALLRRSYDLVAVDPDVGLWRVRLALENTPVLPHDLLPVIRNEVSALWQTGEGRAALHSMTPTIRNPAGRVALALWLNRLDASVAQ